MNKQNDVLLLFEGTSQYNSIQSKNGSKQFLGAMF